MYDRTLRKWLERSSAKCAGWKIHSNILSISRLPSGSGSLAALSAMVTMEIPHINVMSKVDLLDKTARKNMKRFLDPDAFSLLDDDDDDDDNLGGFGNPSSSSTTSSSSAPAPQHPLKRRFRQLTNALARVVDDFSLVRFIPLNISDENSIEEVFYSVNNAIQYGEDADVREAPEIDDVDGDDDVDSGVPDDYYRDL